MSIAQNPLTGQMRKSMGNFNTYVHRGQNVVSSKAFNRKDSNTDAQKVQRAGFKLIVEAYQTLGGFAEMGFPVRAERLSPYNVFMALNLPGAIDDSGETPVIDYSRLQIAKGSLPGVQVGAATLEAAGLRLSLNTNIGFPRASDTDIIRIVAGTSRGTLHTASINRGTVSTLETTLTMTDVSADDIVFVYVFVNTDDGKKSSNSMFVEIND
jgi:hypothetical protein